MSWTLTAARAPGRSSPGARPWRTATAESTDAEILNVFPGARVARRRATVDALRKGRLSGELEQLATTVGSQVARPARRTPRAEPRWFEATPPPATPDSQKGSEQE